MAKKVKILGMGLGTVILVILVVWVLMRMMKKSPSVPSGGAGAYNCDIGVGEDGWLPFVAQHYKGICKPIPGVAPFYGQGMYFCDTYDSNNQLVKAGQPYSASQVKCY